AEGEDGPASWSERAVAPAPGTAQLLGEGDALSFGDADVRVVADDLLEIFDVAGEREQGDVVALDGSAQAIGKGPARAIKEPGLQRVPRDRVVALIVPKVERLELEAEARTQPCLRK